MDNSEVEGKERRDGIKKEMIEERGGWKERKERDGNKKEMIEEKGGWKES